MGGPCSEVVDVAVVENQYDDKYEASEDEAATVIVDDVVAVAPTRNPPGGGKVDGPFLGSPLRRGSVGRGGGGRMALLLLLLVVVVVVWTLELAFATRFRVIDPFSASPWFILAC